MGAACSQCGIWDVLDRDNYCSWCGYKFISLDISIRPSRFVQTDYPPPAELSIYNTSPSNTVEVRSVIPTAKWIAVDSTAVQFPFFLKPNQHEKILVEIDPLDIEQDYCTEQIVVESSVGTESVDVEIIPAPELLLRAGEYEIYLDNLNLEDTYCQIEMAHGIATVRQVTAEPAEWVTARLAENVPLPVTLDARTNPQLEIKLVVDEQKLLDRSTSFPAIYEGSVCVTCDEFAVQEPFRVRCWKPPQMTVWEESDPVFEVYLGRSGEITLTVQNKGLGDPLAGRGNAVLEVRSILCVGDSGQSLPWLVLDESLVKPVLVPGGEFHQFRFKCLTEGCEGAGAEVIKAGIYQLRFSFDTSLVDPHPTVHVELKVTTMPIFQGILAVDFGTSNTCCAMLGRRANDFELLRIDSEFHSKRPTTAPTVVQYLDVGTNGRRQIDIGAAVDALPPEPKVVYSTVRSPKRLLGKNGDEDKYEIRYAHNFEKKGFLSAREVVADYLTRIRSLAEQHGKAVFQSITITHPARFRVNQLKDLKSAVHEAFGSECHITTLQEPVAAALGFIVSDDAQKKDEYTLGVYDFGGGTTDLSLLHVENSREGGLLDIKVQLSSTTGKWFGGEDLTRLVLEEGLARVMLLAPQMRAHVEIPVSLKKANGRKPVDRALIPLARLNDWNLLRWAEQSKFLLIEKGDNIPEALLPTVPGLFPTLKLHAVSPMGTEELYFPYNELVPPQERLYDYLEREVVLLGQALYKLMDLSPYSSLDFLQLSGKSSAIPRVAEVLRRQFPNCEVHLANELKECVVSGACILEKYQASGNVNLSIGVTITTPTRFGLEDVKGGQRVFREWIPAGALIPTSGLSERKPYLFGRREILVYENDGDDDFLYPTAELNKNISELGAYVFESSPDWFPATGRRPGKLEMRVDQNLEVTLTAWIDGYDEPLRLVPKTQAICEPRLAAQVVGS